MQTPQRLVLLLALVALVLVFVITVIATQLRGGTMQAGAGSNVEPEAPKSAAQSSPSRQAQTPARSVRARTGAAADWSAELRKTEDYFEFVTAALEAVEQGDGRAAYYIGMAVVLCDFEIRLARSTEDPERAFREQERPSPPTMPWLAEKSRLKFQRCIRFAKDDPFAALPAREKGYYSVRYWQDLAIELGDVLAKSERAVSLLARAADGKVTPQKRLEIGTAQGYLNDAIRSGDPDVLYGMGMALANGDLSADPTRGVVLMLAACELGYDCSGRTPYTHSVRCDFPAECPDPVDMRDSIEADIGARLYAGLYARAQNLLEVYRRGDESALDAFVRVDGRTASRYR